MKTPVNKMTQLNFATEDAVRAYVSDNYDMILENLYKIAVNSVAAFLIVAKETNDKKLKDACLERLMTDSQTINALKNCINIKYGRYGVDELRYIYDTYTYHDAYEELRIKTRDIWETLAWEYIMPWIDGTKDFKQAIFINACLGIRLTEAYRLWILSVAQHTKYPLLTGSALTKYVAIRKATGYRAVLSECSNQQIIDMYKELDKPAPSWKVLNGIRKRFNYEEEPLDYDSLPIRENPIWKKEHRNQWLFFKETEADLVSEEEAEYVLNEIKSVMHYSIAEIAVLRNWLYIARYEGRAAKEMNMTNSLIKRYSDNSKTNTDSILCKRMRMDIIQTMGQDSRVLRILGKGIGGRMKTVHK